MRDRRDVGDAADLQADLVQRAHRGLAAGPGALDANFDVLHAALLRRAAGARGGDLGSERRRLARALEAGVAGSRPGERVALPVGDGDDGVIERSVDMRDTLRHVLLDLLARAGRRGLLQLLARRCVSASHALYGFPCGYVEFDRRLTRPLARAGVGARALAAHRQSLAMARAAVRVEIDQPLDRHLHLAAQVTFDGELGDVLADLLELAVVQILDLARALHAGGSENRLRARAADAIDRGECDLGVLVVGDVDPCDACHRRNLRL